MDEEKRKLPQRIQDAIVSLAGGVPEWIAESERTTAVKRAYSQGYREGVTEGGNDEPPLYASDGGAVGHGYRSTKATRRDLSEWSQEKANDAAYRVWNTNPLGKTLVEIVVDYVLGPGFVVQAENEQVADILDKFIDDPVNRLSETGAEALVRELGLFGEQLVIAYVRDGSDIGAVADGRLRLGPVDPNQIASVITDYYNPNDLIAVRLKPDDSGSLEDGPIYKVIKAEEAGGPLFGNRDYAAYRTAITQFNAPGSRLMEAEETFREHGVDRSLALGAEYKTPGRLTEAAKKKKITNEQYAGACFFYQLNRISTGKRGRSDLLPLIDWLDRYDQVFFDGAEHVGILNRYVWDLEVKGGTVGSENPENDIGRQVRLVQQSNQNSVYGHNENVKLQAITPDLKTPDLQVLLRALRVFIAGGARIPEHWVAEGGYTNRATAKEMGQPTYRMLTRRQAFVRRMFEDFCRYQIDVAVALGNLPEEVEKIGEDGEPTGEKILARDCFEIEMQDINTADTATAAKALADVAGAVFNLVTTDLLPAKPALQLLASVSQILGVELDVNGILEEKQEIGKADRTEFARSMARLRKDAREPEPEEEEAEDDEE